MQEFWFCEACKSMNRADADRCYRCRAPKIQATMATVRQRQSGVVLTPGLDEEHREVAWTLMLRQTYISAWKLGYVAAALLFLVIVVGMFTAAIEIALMVSRGSPTPVDPGSVRGPILPTALLALGLTGLCAAVIHSVFLGLTSMDAPALGSGSPRFDPVRAGLWWIESSLWAIRAGLAFIGPPFLCVFAISIGGPVLGLLGGLAWAVCFFWLFGDPIASLGKPSRLLKDLWERLTVTGSSDSRIVTLWSGAWGMARGVDFAIAAMVYATIAVMYVANFLASRFDVSIWGSSSDDVTLMAILLADLVVAVEWIADGVALYLLAQVTIELSRRQRIREKWVLAGLSAALARTDAASAASATGMPAAAPAARPVEPTARGVYAGPERAPQWATPADPSGAPTGRQWRQPAGFVPAAAPPQAVPQGPLESAAEPGAATPPEPAADRPVIQPSSTSIRRYGAPRGGDPPRPDEADAGVSAPGDAAPGDAAPDGS